MFFNPLSLSFIRFELGGPFSGGPHGGVDVDGGGISRTLGDVELCCAAWLFMIYYMK